MFFSVFPLTLPCAAASPGTVPVDQVSLCLCLLLWLAWQKPINTTLPPLHRLLALILKKIIRPEGTFFIFLLLVRLLCRKILEYLKVGSVLLLNSNSNTRHTEHSGNQIYSAVMLLSLSHPFVFGETTGWVWGGRLVFEPRPSST